MVETKKLRKIRLEGKTRVVSVTGIIPTDWNYVEISLNGKQQNGQVKVIIKKVA